MDELCEQADIKSMLQEELQKPGRRAGGKAVSGKTAVFSGFMRSWLDRPVRK